MFFRIYRRSAFVLIGVLAVLMSAALTFQQILPDKYYSGSGKTEFNSSYNKIITFCGKDGSAEVFGQSKSSYPATLRLLGIIPIKDVRVELTEDKIVSVCGTPFGIKMFTDGVLIVGLSRISTDEGFVCPAVECGISEGDIICSVNGKQVYTNEDVALSIGNSGGSAVSMLIKRDEKTSTVSVKPVLAADGSGYKIGVWVRDSSAGIGTMTFFDPETMTFAGLGHAVCDVDTGETLSLLSGEIVPAAIGKVKKGVSGVPGELCGNFSDKKAIGTVKINGEARVYGTLLSELDGFTFPIAPKQEVHEGKATILSTINGSKPEEYEINIEKISLSENALTKNMVIKVTDEKLLKQTGGIVQGMSGSPIIQDGKLIGAITHVFVNDPKKGYAIFAENMYSVSTEIK